MRASSAARASLVIAMVLYAGFYLMLAAGGGSFIHECTSLVCGQLHQAVFSAIAAVAVVVSAYRLVEGRSKVAEIVFFGTVPILIVHVILVVTDPNEAIFFPLSTTPPPVVAGIALIKRLTQPSGGESETRSTSS